MFRCNKKESGTALASAKPHLVDSVLTLHCFVRRSKSDPKQEPVEKHMDSETALSNLYECFSRGLETSMTPVPCRHRAWFIRRLLNLQQECRGDSTEHIESVLSAWSAKTSASSVVFAQKLALFDELFVQVQAASVSPVKQNTSPMQELTTKGPVVHVHWTCKLTPRNSLSRAA